MEAKALEQLIEEAAKQYVSSCFPNELDKFDEDAQYELSVMHSLKEKARQNFSAGIKYALSSPELLNAASQQSLQELKERYDSITQELNEAINGEDAPERELHDLISDAEDLRKKSKEWSQKVMQTHSWRLDLQNQNKELKEENEKLRNGLVKLLNAIVAADPNVVNNHKISDLVIRDLYKQVKKLLNYLNNA